MFPASALSEDLSRMMELAQQGFHCAEILLLMGLEGQGKVNPDLIRAVSGLSGGVGSSGDLCGAVTGGACLLGLYSGRGSAEDEEDPRLRIMISDLLDWFSMEQEKRYGGVHCRDIIGEDPRNMLERCPRIVSAVYRKVRSLLDDNGFAWKTDPFSLPREPAAGVCQAACPVASSLRHA